MLIVCCGVAINRYFFGVVAILPVTYSWSPVDLVEREVEVESIFLANFPFVEDVLDVESLSVGP